MHRHQCKNTINNSYGNISPPKSSNHTIGGPEKCNKTEEQDKKLKIPIKGVVRDIEKDISEPINELWKHWQWNEKKTVQEMKREIK